MDGSFDITRLIGNFSRRQVCSPEEIYANLPTRVYDFYG